MMMLFSWKAENDAIYIHSVWIAKRRKPTRGRARTYVTGKGLDVSQAF
jgi:hypothetical protein